ncbi:MAG: NAD(P)H-dependent glycerol-3-phosphate dehydrogenase [Lachnospiraceae bacterium]|nr:NAD(P)H-dependent glycerol-3-phosphate dehydrogenase [Lachnospiraceae bacterium]
MTDISILGSGTWGTALAKTLAQAGNKVSLWSVSGDEIDELKNTHRHRNLPGAVIPESIFMTADMGEAVMDAQIVIIVVPSIFVRSTSESLRPFLKKGQIVACAAKGLEEKTLFTLCEVIEDVIGKNDDNPVVALSGPTHAEEVAIDYPTTIVCASENEDAAKTVQKSFVGTCIRPYINPDIKGVELCGALKNIMALACGISTGLGYGDNTKAAIMTRGMSEIASLGRSLGCNIQTFSGLAGMGDLIVTATSMHSRNNRAGILIGQGVPVDEAVRQVGMVVEGLNALPGARAMAKKYNVSMPIIETMGLIADGIITPKDAVESLFNRDLKSEIIF